MRRTLRLLKANCWRNSRLDRLSHGPFLTADAASQPQKDVAVCRKGQQHRQSNDDGPKARVFLRSSEKDPEKAVRWIDVHKASQSHAEAQSVGCEKLILLISCGMSESSPSIWSRARPAHAIKVRCPHQGRLAQSWGCPIMAADNVACVLDGRFFPPIQ